MRNLWLCAIALLFLSCKAATNATAPGENSSLQDVTISMPKELPWLDSVDNDAKKNALKDMSLSVSATPTSSTQKCTELPLRTLSLANANLTVSGIRLTIKCEYKIFVQISDSKTKYFQTASASLVKTIPDNGIITSYSICLVNEGSLFDPRKKGKCDAAAGSTDTNVDINVQIGGSGQDASFAINIDGLSAILKDKRDPNGKIAQKSKVKFDAYVWEDASQDYALTHIDVCNITYKSAAETPTCPSPIRVYLAKRLDPFVDGWKIDKQKLLHVEGVVGTGYLQVDGDNWVITNGIISKQ